MKYWKLRATIILCSLVIIAVGFMDFSFNTPNFTVLVPSPSPTPKPSRKPQPPKVLNPTTLWDAVQKYRVNNNLEEYIIDNRLCTLARKRLLEIKTDWSHDGFWKHTEDFKYRDLGENLGKDANTETTLLNQWLESKSHKENLDKPYKYSCIETDGLYAVQIFANF